MTSSEIRQRFLRFFQKRGHIIIPSASLVPENDSSVLFTSAGMQQFKPYYLGEKNAQNDFGSLNVTSVQKCVRTSDIEEVGDESHNTFFEMLGNFSFGYKPGQPVSPKDGYWKKEAIQYAYDFITKEMDLKIDCVTVFGGEAGVPSDAESEEIWQSIDQNVTVKKSGRADNFWGPTGVEGPCGPTTEIYIDGIEIWNIVFNQFFKNKDGTLKPLETGGVDTGMGLERLAKVAQKVPTVFETDLFLPLMEKLSIVPEEKSRRIIADHIRTAVFMLDDEVRPSNKERGYILRRLLRRVFAIEHRLNLSPQIVEDVIIAVIDKYSPEYPTSKENKNEIINQYFSEWSKFKDIVDKNEPLLRSFKDKKVSGRDMFALFSSLGIPLEVMKGLGYDVDDKAFLEEMKKHQEVSKVSAEQKFKG